MSKKGRSHSSSARTIERGGIYNHATHGHVEVAGIWQGTQWTDTASRTDEQGDRNPVIVRFIPHADGDWNDEIAATLDQFFDEIETTE